jgi:hypothetical protein
MGTKRFLVTEEEKNNIINLYKIINEDGNPLLTQALSNVDLTPKTDYTLSQDLSLEDKNTGVDLKIFSGTKFVLKVSKDGKRYLMTDKPVIAQYFGSTGMLRDEENQSTELVKKNKAFVYYNCSSGKIGTKKNTIKGVQSSYSNPEEMSWYIDSTSQKQPFDSLCKSSKTEKIVDGSSQNKSNNTQSVGGSNVINDEAWQNLFDKLSVKFNVKIDNKVTTPTQSKFFTIGNFTINRNGVPFIKLGQKGDAGYRSGTIIEKYNNQELDQFKIRVWQGDDQFMPLWVFLNLQTEPKVVDKPKVDSGKKYSGGGGTGNSVGTTYKDCSGSYIKGCKSETIKKVQGCLGLSADGKMGPNTVNVIKSKLGRTYFTDTDVNTLCSNKSKIDTKGQDELDNVEYDVDTKKEEPTPNQSQTTFGGEEF